MNYNEALLRAKNFGSGLLALGLEPGQKTFVCIYSQNRPEWILCEQGCYNYSLVLVPLYDTLGPDACAFIVNQTESTIVVVEDDKKVNLLLDKAPKNLKKLIVIKQLRPATQQRAKNRGIDIHTFEEVEKLGASKDFPEVPPKPTDLCTICYTSGTTGNPKGVMLTHRNVLACIVCVNAQMGEFLLVDFFFFFEENLKFNEFREQKFGNFNLWISKKWSFDDKILKIFKFWEQKFKNLTQKSIKKI